jgi:tryptophan halogenase
VYSSEFSNDDAALTALLSELESPAAMTPKQLRFTTGKRRKQWSRNVVSIGLASGFLEPLESTSIHLIQLAIGYLIDLFPDRHFDPGNETEFNRIMALEYERVRDFLILHYHATERDDTPFWNYCRNMQIPDSLDNRLQLFRERGIVPHYREGMFLDASWLAVYFGQRVMPRHYDPLANRVPEAALRSELARMRSDCVVAANDMPEHDNFLQQLGAQGVANNAG